MRDEDVSGSTGTPEAVDEDELGELTPLLSWDVDVPLVNNRFMLWDITKVTLISAGVMWGVVALMSLVVNGEPLFLPIAFVGLITGIVWVVFVIACLILLNRWRFTITLYEQGVGYASGAREKGVNRALTYLGFLALLSGSAGGLGSALIARSQEDGFYLWEQMHRLNVHEGPRVISLRNSWRVMFRIYCTPDTYERALALCERKVADAAAYRLAHPVTRRPLPWRRWLAWAALGSVGFAAGLSFDGARDEAIGPWLLAGAVALAFAGALQGPLRRALGVLAAALAGWFVYLTYTDGARPALPDFVAAGLGSPPVYAGEEVAFALSLLGGALIAAAGLWRAVGPRPR